MTKKQYYYTCPIKALYMMKEFGVRVYVKLENKDSEIINFYTFKDYFNMKSLLSYCKIYVAQKSNHIFQPKNGDLAEKLYHFYEFNGKKWREVGTDSESNITYPKSKYANYIVMRCDRPFFSPKVEEVENATI
mgnify:CR=1 FL=1